MVGLRKYPGQIAPATWNDLIDFLGGETSDPQITRPKIEDFWDPPFWENIPDKPETYPPSSHSHTATVKRSVALVVPGDPSAGATVSARIIVPVAGTVSAVKSICKTAPTSDYTYDIHKNGTTIYTTQANRPTRTAGDGTGAKTHTLPDVTSIAAGNVLEVDLDVKGAGIVDVVLFVEFNESVEAT